VAAATRSAATSAIRTADPKGIAVAAERIGRCECPRVAAACGGREEEEEVRMEGAVKKSPLVVYTIVERPGDKKTFWVRIGAAFRNHDGSLNAYLDAVPVNGKMHIREPRPWGERDAAPMPSDADLAAADALTL
jgi:hypothetical protein